ncbi:NAD(P)-dependent oxidoreductase [Lacticaseibacillus paracasei]|jgi:putative NADH-flavin reductase|uniref:NAD(P)-dependent oxidoreductase n=1 Tax=Lacticaseibacillus paracasei TaxID=1597 RepID=UPI0009782FE7|nr:NAD(P)H-binding protein [Lacticaseibacillus paracasei]
MKIAIIGATGHAGSAIFKEALKRGHEVTGYVRHPDKSVGILPPDADLIQQDAFTLTREQLTGYDAVIDAFATTIEQAYLHIDLADHLIHELRNTDKPRVIFILGAGSLKNGDQTLYDTLKKDPHAAAFINTPLNQFRELQLLRWTDNVNWLGISPSANFQPGPATAYVRGKDELLKDDSGKSVLNSDTLAVALLDELENPTIKQARFTARND